MGCGVGRGQAGGDRAIFLWLSDVAIELFDGFLMEFVEYMCR